MATRSFPPPLIILSPPRSFSSVVSTMLGEHPQMYGFPELQLFLNDTVEANLRRTTRRGNPFTRSGVLRTLAQIHDGEQTTAAVARATVWLSERREWTTKQLTDYFLQCVSPQIGVEKSPETVMRRSFIERAFSYYPDAHYLHLTRHPLSARESLREFMEARRPRTPGSNPCEIEQILAWHMMHRTIVGFTSTLPTGQSLRVRGEDILANPDTYLPQIAEWMGLRTDAEAIEAMKHPENSPFASIGPAFAYGGNDEKFMRSPALRPARARTLSLKGFFEANPKLTWMSPELESGPLEHTTDEATIRAEVSELAGLLGYW